MNLFANLRKICLDLYNYLVQKLKAFEYEDDIREISRLPQNDTFVQTEDLLPFTPLPGGSITEFQHQDVIPIYNRLKQECAGITDDLINLFCLPANDFKLRYEIRSYLAIILVEDYDFSFWYNTIKRLGDGIEISSILKRRILTFFNSVIELKATMSQLNPKSYFRSYTSDNFFDNSIHRRASNKTQSSSIIIFTVFPALFCGDSVDEKAVVYTT